MSVSLCDEESLSLRCLLLLSMGRENLWTGNDWWPHVLEVLIWLNLNVLLLLRLHLRIIIGSKIWVSRQLALRLVALQTWVDELSEWSLVSAGVIVTCLLRSFDGWACILANYYRISLGHYLISFRSKHLSFLHLYLANWNLRILITH